jgi:phage-related minor tail protein
VAIVGNLVANLTANTDGFTTPLRQAEGVVSRLARTLTGGLLGPIGMVGGALAALGTAFTVTSFVQSAREAERSSKKLDAVLSSTGGAAGVTGDEIRQLAGDLQRVTDFEDDATIGAAGVLATFTQIRGDTFKSAIVAAQDLSAVMGQDLQSSVVQVGKALNDPIKGITALSRVGVSFSEQQKQQIKQLMQVGDIAGAQAVILGELQKEFGGAAQAVSDPFTRMANVIGDIGESIGGAILPTLQAVAEMVASQVLPNIESVQTKFAGVGDTIYSYVVPAIQKAIAYVTNWRAYAEIGILKVQLAFVQFGNTVAHVLTEMLPAYMEWFGNNWRALFTDLVSFTQTVFANLGENIGGAMTAIWDYIASGGTESLSLSWTPLLEGFKATAEALPQVAERIPSELEKKMQATLGTLQTEVANSMKATLDGLQTAVNKKPITPRVEETKKKKEGEMQPTAATSGVQALQQGSSAAISAIFSAMRTQDKEAEMLAIQQQQLAIQQQQLAALEDMSQSEGVEID